MAEWIEPFFPIDEALALARRHAQEQYHLELICVLGASFVTRESVEWSRDYNRKRAEKEGRDHPAFSTYQTRVEDHWLVILVDGLGGYSIEPSGRRNRGMISFAVYADRMVEVVHAPTACGRRTQPPSEPPKPN